jgi:hypothetical protein
LADFVPSIHSYNEHRAHENIHTIGLATDPNLDYDGYDDACSDDDDYNCNLAPPARLEAVLEFCHFEEEFPTKVFLMLVVDTRCPDDGQATASVTVFKVSRTESLRDWFKDFRLGRYGPGAAEIEFPARYEAPTRKYTRIDVSVNIKVSIRKETLSNRDMFVVKMEGKILEKSEGEEG